MKKKRKILKKLKEKGFLTNENTINNYEQKIKKQEAEIKNVKDKVSSVINRSFGSVDGFISFLRTL